MLQNQRCDVLISTPGRIATILRTKNSGLDLTSLQAMVLDEVDILLIDETFGPQLRTVGAAAPVDSTQFVFVTATLPDTIVETVEKEFSEVTKTLVLTSCNPAEIKLIYFEDRVHRQSQEKLFSYLYSLLH